MRDRTVFTEDEQLYCRRCLDAIGLHIEAMMQLVALKDPDDDSVKQTKRKVAEAILTLHEGIGMKVGHI